MVPTRQVSHATSPIRSKDPQPQDPDPAKPSGSRTKQKDYVIETMAYKTVDNLQLKRTYTGQKLHRLNQCL